MLKVGIIGAGFIADSHANAYRLMDNIELTGISDVCEEAGRDFAVKFGCTYYPNAEKLLERSDIDIIDICLPTFLHEKYVIMSASYGKHILCEKPFTIALDSADRMLEAVNNAGVKFMIAQVVRFWPEYEKIKEICDCKGIGDVKVVYANRLSQHPNWSNWFKDVEKSGGGLFDLHLHDIDFMSYLLGPVESVYATGKQSENGAWNYVITILNFRNGCKACVEGGYEMTDGYPFTNSLRAFGSEGTIELNINAGYNIKNINEGKRELVHYKKGCKPNIINVEQKDAYANEIEYFVKCVYENKKPEVVMPEESRVVLGLIHVIKRSLETGEVQNI